MDEVIRFNKERWEELSANDIQFSRPWLDLDKKRARERIDPEGQLGKIRNRKVLCLAASGGQQSAAFALLGACVTVFDLSENQLEKDQAAASHYGFSVKTIQGDMQDLSIFKTKSFDIIWLAHSINFVPDIRRVIYQIALICRPKGLLRMSFTNPYVHGIWDCFNGKGYTISSAYTDGGEVYYENPEWDFKNAQGQERKIKGPKEFRHRLSTIINTLVKTGFIINGFWEEADGRTNAVPGSWEHFTTIAPPWLTIWAQKKK